jgi:two-component sensor histidine kinase
MAVECVGTERSKPILPLHIVDEINHRVINEYAEAISALALAARSSNPEAQAAIREAAARLRAHVEAHRALVPPVQDGPVNLATYLGDLCASLSRASLADCGVRIALRTDEIRVAPDTAWRIGLILAELVRNGCRHGLAGGPGAIAVRVTEHRGIILCLVADSGRGNPHCRMGRGRRLARAIAAELGGSVDWWFSPTGSLARLEVPKGPAPGAERQAVG